MKRPYFALWLAIPVFLLLAAPSYWYFIDRLGRTLLETHNEGWVAYFADRAISSRPLYPLPPELIQNNYPPLAFYMIGGLGKLLGNTILAGRILSLVALAVIAAAIFLLVRQRNRVVGPGLFAAVFFLAFFAVYPGGRIGLNDPELLAHAIMAVALVVLDRTGATFRGALAASLVMALAGLTKHNLIAVPLGVLLWALASGPAVLRRWVAAMTLAGLAAAVVLRLGWGQAALSSILVPRQMSLTQGFADTRNWINLASLPLFVVLAAWIGRRWPTSDTLPFWVVLVAILEIVLFAPGVGVNSNVAYDLIFALSWAVGRICARADDPRGGMVVAAGMVFHLALTMPMQPARVMFGAAPGKAVEEQSILKDVAWLRAHPGRAICFDLALCYYAGDDFEYDRFNMGQQFIHKRRDRKELFDPIEAHVFAVIELERGDIDNTQSEFQAELNRIILANYRIVRENDDRVFLVPLAN